MKRLVLIFLVLFVSKLFSQDTLFQVSGEKQAVKVTEVNPNFIKYRKSENITGPLYSIAINDVRYIKYSGGHIDSFKVAEVQKISVPEIKPNNKMVYYGTKIFYNSNSISEEELKNLIKAYPDKRAAEKMEHSYRQMMAHRDIATASLACGLVLGCAVVVATAPFVTGLNSGFGIPTAEGMLP